MRNTLRQLAQTPPVSRRSHISSVDAKLHGRCTPLTARSAILCVVYAAESKASQDLILHRMVEEQDGGLHDSVFAPAAWRKQLGTSQASRHAD
jgi:hypothetical protein